MRTGSHAWTPETVTAEPYNAQTPTAALVPHLTPADALFVRDHFGVPRLDAQTWRLGLSGHAERPYHLGYGDLLALERHEIETVLECAGNGRSLMTPRPPGLAWGERAVGCVRFTGVPFAVLAERLAPRDDAVGFVFTGADTGELDGRVLAFERSLPIAAALHPDTLLATHLNGRPLTAEHGAPVRLVVPGRYGVADVKWLVAVRAVAEPFEGPFQTDSYVYRGSRGGTEDGPVTTVRVRTLVTAPEPGRVLRPGETVHVRGHAWSGAGPVRRVEVRADDGNGEGGEGWRPAVLAPSTGRYGWTDWTFSWTAPDRSGSHRLTVRATDAAGTTQPLRPPWNAEGYGCNPAAEVTVTVQS